MNNHSENEQLSAYLDGELTLVEQGRIDALLGSNADAQRSLEELRSVRAGLALLPRHTLPADFAERVLLRIRSLNTEGSTGGLGAPPQAIPFSTAQRRSNPPARRAFRYVGYAALAAAAAIAVIVVTARPQLEERPVASARPARAGDSREVEEAAVAKAAADKTAPATPSEAPAPLAKPSAPAATASPAKVGDTLAVTRDMPKLSLGKVAKQSGPVAGQAAEINSELDEAAERLDAYEGLREKNSPSDTAPASAAPASGPAGGQAGQLGDRLAGTAAGRRRAEQAGQKADKFDSKTGLAFDINRKLEGSGEARFSKMPATSAEVDADAAEPAAVRQVEVEVSADALQRGDLVNLFSRQNLQLYDEPVTEELLKDNFAKNSNELDRLNTQAMLARGNVARKGMSDDGQPGEVHVVTAMLDAPQYKTLVKELSSYPGFRCSEPSYDAAQKSTGRATGGGAGRGGLGKQQGSVPQREEATQLGANATTPQTRDASTFRGGPEIAAARNYFNFNRATQAVGRTLPQAYRFRAPDEPTAQKLATVILNQATPANIDGTQATTAPGAEAIKDEEKIRGDKKEKDGQKAKENQKEAALAQHDVSNAAAANRPAQQAPQPPDPRQVATGKVQVLFMFRVVDPAWRQRESPAASIEIKK